MIQYAVLFASGFAFLYQLLVLWGLSARLVSPGPYYALLGGLIVFPFAAAASLRLPRVAAWAALVGGILGLAWPVTGLVLGLGGWAEMPFFAALPMVIIGFSFYRVLRLRAMPGARVRLPVALAVLLAALPVALFFVMFDIGAIAGAILRGPPPWPHRG